MNNSCLSFSINRVSACENPKKYGKSGGINHLHLATLQNDFSLVKELVKDGFDVNEKDGMGWTPLRFASAHGALEIMKFLVANGAKLESTSARQWTCLHSAAGLDHVDCLKFLLASGASADAISIDGLTPLHVAVCYGSNPESITLLIENGKADTEILENNGFSPLHLACMNGRISAVKALLDLGCDPFLIMTTRDKFRPAIEELLSKSQAMEDSKSQILQGLLIVGRFLQLLVQSGEISTDLCFYTLEIMTKGNSFLSRKDIRLFSKLFLDRSTIGFVANCNRRFSRSALKATSSYFRLKSTR